jgi:hypothetical protein
LIDSAIVVEVTGPVFEPIKEQEGGNESRMDVSPPRGFILGTA